MSATEIVAIAIALAVLNNWANNKGKGITVKMVIEAIFVVIFIAVLDNGVTEPIATGFAWLLLAAVVLSGGFTLFKALSTAEAKGSTVKKAS